MSDWSPLALRRIDAPVDVIGVFRALAARYADVFWLDAGDEAADGWSVLGLGVPDVDGPGDVRLDVAPTIGADEPPFRGGWVGWLDYDAGAVAAGAPAAATEDGPVWLRVQNALAIDHSRGAVWLLGAEGTVSEWLAEATASGTGIGIGIGIGTGTGIDTVPTSATRLARARHDPAEYAALIESCRDAIRAGTAYQLCLTTRFEVVGTHDPVETYLRLRSATPAHHSGFVRIGDRALLSASPETFLHATAGRVRTRPIKGTRPRGDDPKADVALAAELRGSAKERAENVMIVDLMRNDLSRVCVPGTIRVEGLWEVESYPAVHQLVSTVSGVVVDGLTVHELWDATFPAGSMTGAPKLSAMTVLHELEGGAPRGVYSGCFGYVGVDGSVDLAMVIRSIVMDAERAVVGAGGGITWGSEPAAEVAEVATKARAPLAALGADLPDAWRR